MGINLGPDESPVGSIELDLGASGDVLAETPARNLNRPTERAAKSSICGRLHAGARYKGPEVFQAHPWPERICPKLVYTLAHSEVFRSRIKRPRSMHGCHIVRKIRKNKKK